MTIPGNPRLVPVAGGEHQSGDPDPIAVVLQEGSTTLGDPVVAEITVNADGLVTLTGVPATVVLDGAPVTEAVLVHGNRITLPEGDVVFQAEKLDDDGGRQGGEEPFARGLADVDTLDRS
jgi:hypothetical protein